MANTPRGWENGPLLGALTRYPKRGRTRELEICWPQGEALEVDKRYLPGDLEEKVRGRL